MAHEILSVKLCELEDQLSRLSSRIHLSETAGRPQLLQEIRALRRECDETELTLQAKLRRSRTGTAAILADFYGEAERNARRTRATLEEHALRCDRAEEKILLAEYALDFALQWANRALLLAMEAIDAQNTDRKGDDASS